MKIILDARRMDVREEAHVYLKEKLNFPKYYGENLDALYECLCELADTELIVTNACEAERYYPEVEEVLSKAAAGSRELILTFGETEAF